jgi:hypothetical protein
MAPPPLQTLHTQELLEADTVLSKVHSLDNSRQPSYNSLRMIPFNYALWETLNYGVRVKNQHSLQELQDNICWKLPAFQDNSSVCQEIFSKLARPAYKLEVSRCMICKQ